MSSVATEYGAIVAYWITNCPVAAPRRCYTDLGGPKFDRPKITSYTNSNLTTVMGGLVWIRLSILGVSNSGTPTGIGPGSKSQRTGLIVQDVFFPSGFGLNFVLPIVDTARAVFHRKDLSSGLILCRDTDAPVRVFNPEDENEGWGHFSIVTPYQLREA